MTDDEYIPVEEVAAMLGVKIRQAARYGERVRTKMVGRRMIYHRGDVQAIADERAAQQAAATRGEPYKAHVSSQPRADIVPASELLNMVSDLQNKLLVMSHRVGELEGQLQQRLLPDEAAHLRETLAALEAERDTLRAELERMRRPWWKRLLD